jgi:UTP--glucose-1-phosphate uridylyltransferase
VQLIVKEASDSGIEEVIFVTGRGKSSIIDHFDMHTDLVRKLRETGKEDLALVVEEINDLARVTSVRQQEPKGLGHAVLCAKHLVGDEPFMVLLGDDLVDASPPCTQQMIDVFDKHQKSVVALQRVGSEEVSDFGICGGQTIADRVYELDSMVEKPSEEDAPSNLAIVGRYVLKPEIFEYLEATEPDDKGEIQLTDAMARMMKVDGFTGYEFSGKRFDAGDKFGFLQANISYGLKRRDIAPRLKAYLRDILNN